MLEVAKIDENGLTENDILVHDETNKTVAMLLAHMQPPEYPVARGVLYCSNGQEYGDAVHGQIEAVKSKTKAQPMNDLLHSGHTWQVGA